MAGISSPDHLKSDVIDTNRSHKGPLIVITTLFFMWGLLSHLNDILSPHLQNIFHLDYFQANIIPFTFFGAYFIMSFPCSFIIKKIGYKNGILVGLVTCAIGSALFYPAANIREFWAFLGALFVLASGITMLQVGANAYVTIL